MSIVGIPDDAVLSVPEFVEILERDPGAVVCLDVETTGLDTERDGIVSLSIVDASGETLFDSRLHTYRRSDWTDAQRIHGISPRDVRDSPSVPQVRDEVETILDDAEVIVGYNHVGFDLPMMASNGFRIPDAGLFDVMLAYIDMTGPEVRHRLVDCARHCKVDFSPHHSLDDARATMACAKVISGCAGVVV